MEVDQVWRQIPLEDNWTLMRKNEEIHVKHDPCGNWMHGNLIVLYRNAGEAVVCQANECEGSLPVPKKILAQILLKATFNNT